MNELIGDQMNEQAISNAFSRGYEQGYADASTAWREERGVLLEALRQIATVEANDPDEAAAGFKQTRSYKIAVEALGK